MPRWSSWAITSREELSGSGSSHLRENDGLWAVPFWLNIIAERRLSIAEVLGRYYHSRHDWDVLQPDVAADLMECLRSRLPDLPGSTATGLTVPAADAMAGIRARTGSRQPDVNT
ncbi:MAG: hypothetical protein OXI95_11605 [bacterium]|nr:hypothetical protein [bacterium]